jgi:hypothetical protein
MNANRLKGKSVVAGLESLQRLTINLIQVLRENPFNSVTEAHNETNFPGSLRTARRRVKEGSELRNHPAVKKPFLTQQKNTE